MAGAESRGKKFSLVLDLEPGWLLSAPAPRAPPWPTCLAIPDGPFPLSALSPLPLDLRRLFRLHPAGQEELVELGGASCLGDAGAEPLGGGFRPSWGPLALEGQLSSARAQGWELLPSLSLEQCGSVCACI